MSDVRSSFLRTLTFSTFMAWGAMSTGCAGMQARQAHIEAETHRYAFDEDTATVLAAAQELLFTRGYTVTASGPNTLETDWMLSDDGEHRSRQLVKVLDVDEGRKVSAMRAAQSLSSKGKWYGGAPQRDARFELDVIEQVDPSTAARIRSEAEAARDEARG